MRIIIDTESQEGAPVVHTGSTTANVAASAFVDGGSGPSSPDRAEAMAPASDGILTIEAGQPSASLVAAIAAAGGSSSTPRAIDAGPAPVA